MTLCVICGKNIGFFSSFKGKQLCDDCTQTELRKKEAERQKGLAELHIVLTKNLNASSTDQLEECSGVQSVISRYAHSVKNNEKVYVLCAATAKRLKFVKSQRANRGTSLLGFGLKGRRIYSSFGQSIPIHNYVDVGTGVIVLTNKNIHLCTSSGKPLKIPYSKIEGFHLYDDGLEIYHGLQKPTLFLGDCVGSHTNNKLGEDLCNIWISVR